MKDPAISIEDLHVSYFGNEAVTGVSLTVNTGNLVGIIGPNGAGKSTFLKAMLNLIPKDKGAVRVMGKSIAEVRKSIAYVPQRNAIDWDFPITVHDAVLIGTYPHLKLFRRPKKKDKEWAMECLQRVGMQEFSKRQIGELSGGQQQRVFLARALAQKADLFFLDEPFVGVDVSSEETIVNILKELCRQGKTVIVVHHDLSKANDYFNQLILLNKELISFGTVEEVFKPEVIAKAYKGQFAFMNEIGVSL
ncbi:MULTISPECIES: metal ABC transporter ATP-binding protein [Cytobacillus]|uniref:Metal ABC transporter ATP-binding protein n=1 Tax=Cytobacillus pseudoceanisediminis TaxID=3051614 RepID=A0ABZ2ZR89_9BACI|nr:MULTISPECIES: metal ABC transporter ATP-binding protein [Cytobacillus]MBY0156436.1 metal ABC transporter ATP-binding protein [Cytobacillus firmus]MCM3392314.1 metal ABC transporter ATP-binding protein [Cytobacillus oceanisediminis]MCM3404406.1 metal ABC transporter ATP-binding protein [Cytobacillus oceanisediminis]MCM3530698.1 metal ABC transporter ATP-binding protein [Cytobacillus oceanisediminis]MDK7668495.1 metal ABC transporter ATP-binding protein [Cytobacillus oceanisediminis]